MKKLLLVFFFSIFFLNSEAQTSVYHPFPDSDAVWNIYFRDAFALYSDQRYSYILTGDTIINAILYHKLETPLVLTHFSSFQKGYVGGIRQNIPAKKVFYIPAGDTLEQLLYDFNLQLGDTVHRYVTNDYIGCDEDPQKIYAIDSILIGGTYRKRWQVSPYFRTPPYFIEGIGSAVGLLEPICHISSDQPDYFLSCFTQNGQVLYHPDSTFYGAFSCDVILSVNSLSEKNNSLSVYPNPASDLITINTGGLLRSFLPRNDVIASEAKQSPHLIIYNVLGENVYSAQLKTQNSQPTTTIDISSLKPGIYFIEVNTEENINRAKFIKE